MTYLKRIGNIPISESTIQKDRESLSLQMTPIFEEPQALHWDGYFLWVGNKDNSSLYKIDISTPMPTLVTSISVSPASQIRKIVSDSNYVYCATLNGGRLMVVSKATNDIVGIGDSGISTNRKIRCVDLDGAGNVYVTSKHPTGLAAGRVDKYVISSIISAYPSTATPTATFSFTGTDQGEEIVFAAGSLWVTGEASRKLHKINTALTTESVYTHGSDSLIGIRYLFGSIWVATGSNDVLRFDTSTFPAGGSLIATITIPNTGVSFGLQTRDLASDGTTVWVSNFSATPEFQAYRISTGLGSESLVSSIKFSDPNDGCCDIIFDGTNIWTAAQFSTSTSSPGTSNMGLRKISVDTFGQETELLSFLGPAEATGIFPSVGRLTYVGLANLVTTSSASFTTVGFIAFDPSQIPLTNGNKSRFIKFEVAGGNAGAGNDLEVRLIYYSGGNIINNSTFTINIIGPVLFASSELSVAWTNNDLSPSLNGYFVQMRNTGGVGSVKLYLAQLVVTYE